MDLENKLIEMVNFLEKFHTFVDSCSVDFIVNDLYTNSLPPTIQKELIELSENQLVKLPSALFVEENESYNNGEIGSVISQLRHLRLENLNLVNDVEIESTKNTLLDHFDKIMPRKKTHEVCRMFKGYLSHAMATLGDIPVLAVDGQELNSKGAEVRGSNLASKWKGLKARAEDRIEGREVSNRKKRRKKKQENEECLNEDLEQKQDVVNITRFVEVDSDCTQMVQNNLGNNHSRFGIIGLHTCGDLASTSIRAFIASAGATFLCNVGCCYHHLREQFYSHPFLAHQASMGAKSGYPLSTVLKNRKHFLGRSSRMLAAQPLSRLANKSELPSSSLLWRAMLQVLLVKHAPHLSNNEVQVGRLASKSVDFKEYARKAFNLLGLKLDMTEEDLSNFYLEHEANHRKKLIAFHQFRTLFAPLVEHIILVDRLCFLRQHVEIRESYIARLFDCSISPRAYAVVGFR